jgi:hypothetical protein
MMPEGLQKDLFLLVGYLLTSAHGLYDEPAGYGSFRLLDACGRLLAIMQSHDLGDSFLQQLHEEIEKERFGTSDDAQLRIHLNELVLRYTGELKQRAGDAADKQEAAL